MTFSTAQHIRHAYSAHMKTPWHAYLMRPASVLKGLGEKQAARLDQYMSRKRRSTHPHALVRDLLFHLPHDYIDRRHIVPLVQAVEGTQTLRVRVLRHLPDARHPARNRPAPYKVQCEDDTASLLLVFFRGDTRYLKEQLPEGGEVILSGQLQRYDGMWQMTHPEVIAPPSRKDAVCRLDPLYPATEGISSRMFSRWLGQVLDDMPTAPEWIAPSTLKHHRWDGFGACITCLHRPHSLEAISTARARLAYDEALAHQLSLRLLRRSQRRLPGVSMPLLEAQGMAEAIAALPFALTEGQQEVLADIDADMRSGNRMLRLLQGDVGAGKTVIAALSMLAAVRSGYQAALMAPTEIVARQHLRSLDQLLGVLDVPVIFLAGSLTPRQREEARERLKHEPASLIVGTHALFQEGVEFANLGLCVIDEQHRFGVEQRMALAEKGAAVTGFAPHMLLMTATPIPRSLQMVQYGDLDVSALRQKPAGRQHIDTRAIGLGKLPELFDGIRRALAAGEKIYWICPLVEESTAQGGDWQLQALQAAQARFDALEVAFPGKAGLVHGRMSMEEREPVMQAFRSGEIRMLVATVVVEVGVDVPDATIMVIENAERFGLAQLHQLRGRVGRGDKPSRCLLLYDERCSSTARQRLKTMRETNDGFVIAEADLKLRGGGDILGTRQTGVPDFQFLDADAQQEWLKSARQEADIALEEDPALTGQRGQALRQLLALFDLEDATRFLTSG